MEVSTRSLPLVAIGILDDAQSAAFLKIEVTFSICMSDELVGALPTCGQSSSLPWLLHLYHRLTYNQALKQMLTCSGIIDFLLLLLSLLHIEQNVVMDACNELHFLQKLSCGSFHINSIVSFISQGLQVVVCSQMWCSASKDHEWREFCTLLDPTSVPK